jgi:hypothetical protein
MYTIIIAYKVIKNATQKPTHTNTKKQYHLQKSNQRNHIHLPHPTHLPKQKRTTNKRRNSHRKKRPKHKHSNPKQKLLQPLPKNPNNNNPNPKQYTNHRHTHNPNRNSKPNRTHPNTTTMLPKNPQPTLNNSLLHPMQRQHHDVHCTAHN